MSIVALKIDDPNTKEQIRSVVGKYLSNALPGISLPDELELKITRQSNHLAVDWTGHVEAVTPGPDPDLMRARLYRTYAEIDLRLSNVRIGYEL